MSSKWLQNINNISVHNTTEHMYILVKQQIVCYLPVSYGQAFHQVSHKMICKHFEAIINAFTNLLFAAVDNQAIVRETVILSSFTSLHFQFQYWIINS